MLQVQVLLHDLSEGCELALGTQGLLVGQKSGHSLTSSVADCGRINDTRQSHGETAVDTSVGAIEFCDDLVVHR